MLASSQLLGRRMKAGFTLIEVLIVVVIIGVLAALVIPRFVAAPEKAIVAEGSNMLGALIRAQQSRLDTGGSWAGAGTLTSANWLALGMQSPATTKFTFACASPTCTAARSPGGTASTVTLGTAGTWTCSGGYTPMTNGGCTVI